MTHKTFKSEPSNEAQDAFALEHGTAVIMSRDHVNGMRTDWLIVSEESINYFKYRGYRVRWHIDLSDFYPGGDDSSQP